ncbi:type VI secretion system Vgr family protein [Legionella sp. 16cNR16C]|uniref:type VI secretion system Vgr family protein n=1 Tax=Legionella sp. 16cNR16C TaxID=2905656 RepID=UPI001E33D919|nr:type VI secretion system tip protein TssI/VgrG [Legionella sp. 16cNR16C]MCE3045899.1 type VI secretion system tip protein VgrG [Legionella sp. 16cNR16C]
MQNQILMPRMHGALFEGSETEILQFEGTMGVSELYEFRVELASKRLILGNEIINHPAKMTFTTKGGAESSLHGRVHYFSHTDSLDEYYVYQMIIQPEVTRLQKTRRTHVYLEKRIEEILRHVFQRNNINHVRFDLVNSHPVREFVFQYNEVDWQFVTRWMEQEGLFYFFEHTADNEVLVITDSNSTLQLNKDINRLFYHGYTTDSEFDPMANLIYDFQFTTASQPAEVKVKSYNYQQSSKSYNSSAAIDPQGVGEIVYWAENVQSQEENQRIANQIAESFKWQKEIFNGTASAALINPGSFIQHQHFKLGHLNKPMLIIHAKYSGSQKKSFFSYHSVAIDAAEDHFSCDYRAIDKAIPFRSVLQTPIPRISGVLPGFVDHEGGEDTVQINEKGHYKFRIAISDDGPGKGSRWVRKLESYIGDKYAFSLPMRKGMEVAIGFHFGNPDLPILLGAIDNSTHRNLIISDNQHYMGLQTKENNVFFINEQKGKTQGIKLRTPHNNTTMILGTDNIFQSQQDMGYYLSTLSHSNSYIGKDANITVKQNKTLSVDKDYTRFVKGNATMVCHQDTNYQVKGNETVQINQSQYNFIDQNVMSSIGKHMITEVNGNFALHTLGSHINSVKGFTGSYHLGATIKSYTGCHITDTTGIDIKSVLGGFIQYLGPFSMHITQGFKYTDDSATSLHTSPMIIQEALGMIMLQVGGSSLIIDPSGIKIVAPSLTIDCPATNVSAAVTAFDSAEFGVTGNVTIGGALISLGIPSPDAAAAAAAAGEAAAAVGAGSVVSEGVAAAAEEASSSAVEHITEVISTTLTAVAGAKIAVGATVFATDVMSTLAGSAPPSAPSPASAPPEVPPAPDDGLGS